jgi:tetratricopeptide (TPR) repeat protein
MVSFVGQTVSHFRILEQIGRGGMGLVYKAEDLTLGRVVAIKFLPPDITPDPQARQRFIREAQAASALDHVNICTVHEIGETPDGQVFIVMAYCDGETLRHSIDAGTMTVDDTLDYAVQICSGLTKVHEKGIIHRDIKPANIIITDDGVAKILDFGLALLGGGTSLTRPGFAVGTAAYMSPEQAQGAPVDARSDLFSLGAVMYEMISGKRPFPGDHDAAVLYAILNADPPAPSRETGSIPPALDAVVLRLLAKKPAERYQSAREVRTDLQRLRPAGTAGSSGSGRPTRPVRASNNALGRVRMSRKAIAGIVSLLLGLAVVGWFAYPRLFPETPKGGPWRVGIVPFQTLTSRPPPPDWPQVVQMIMVDHLNGVEELRVIDPFTFNSMTASGGDDRGSTFVLASARQMGAGFLVNGTIESLDTAFILRCTLIDVADGSVRLSTAAPCASERELPQCVQRLSGQILSYFQIQTLTRDGRLREDLQPWLSQRTKNLEAIKAFVQGTQLMARWQPGGDAYFKKAIDLDSTFVTPRTWLISGFVHGGKRDEAGVHQAFLQRHLFDNGPFEQALVRWTGAMIAGDVSGQANALEAALEYSPGNDVLLYLLADLRASQEDFSRSARTIRIAVESGWNFQPASLLLGWDLLQLGAYAECREVLERSLTFEIVLPETYAILAAVALRTGDQTAAQGYAQEFTSRLHAEGASQDSILSALAAPCATAGMHEQASAYYGRAIDINPRKAEYRLGLAHSAVALGSMAGAQVQANAALALDPASLAAHDVLGRVAASRRDTASALGHYRLFLAGDSTSRQSRDVRLRARQLLGDQSPTQKEGP